MVVGISLCIAHVGVFYHASRGWLYLSRLHVTMDRWKRIVHERLGYATRCLVRVRVTAFPRGCRGVATARRWGSRVAIIPLPPGCRRRGARV